MQVCLRFQLHSCDRSITACEKTVTNRAPIKVPTQNHTEQASQINRTVVKKMCVGAAYGKSPYGEHLKAVAEGRVKY